MRSLLADRGNLLETRFDSSRSQSATIQTFMFDTALVGRPRSLLRAFPVYEMKGFGSSGGYSTVTDLAKLRG